MTRDVDTYLTEAEIADLTKRKYGKAQCRRLAILGVPFLVGPDNKPVVLRKAHDQVMGVKTPQPRRRRPRLDALSA